MDRIEFSKSINIDPVIQIRDCFDEVMALYNLIEGIDYAYINGQHSNEDGQQRMIFSISLKDSMTTESMMTMLNANHVFTIYEKTFSIIAKSTDNILDIEMILI